MIVTFLGQLFTRLGSVSIVLVVPRITTTWSGGGGGGGATATTGGGAGARGATGRRRGLGVAVSFGVGVGWRVFNSANAQPHVFLIVLSVEIRSTSWICPSL